MAGTSGYTSTTRAAIALGPGIVQVGSAAMAATTGAGATLEIERTWRRPVVHGATAPIRGLDYLVGISVRIKVTVLEWRAAVLSQLAMWDIKPSEPSATGPASQSWASVAARTWASAAGDGWSILVQGQVARGLQLLSAAQTTITDLRCVFDGQDGTKRRLYMPYAIATIAQARGQVGGEATWDVTFEARLEPSGSPLDVTAMPYRWEIA